MHNVSVLIPFERTDRLKHELLELDVDRAHIEHGWGVNGRGQFLDTSTMHRTAAHAKQVRDVLHKHEGLMHFLRGVYKRDFVLYETAISNVKAVA